MLTYEETFSATQSWNMIGCVAESTGEPLKGSRGRWHGYDLNGSVLLTAWLPVHTTSDNEVHSSTEKNVHLPKGTVVKLMWVARFDASREIVDPGAKEFALRARPSSSTWRVDSSDGYNHSLVRTDAPASINMDGAEACAPAKIVDLNASMANYLANQHV